MTPRRLEVLKFIAKFIDHAGCSPTLAQIADAMSLSRVSVLEHINRLETDLFLTRTPNVARSIELTETGWSSARGEPSITLPLLTAQALVEGCRRALPSATGDLAQYLRDALDQLRPQDIAIIGAEV